MQHIRFKAEQTAAHYVANGLDDETQEAFELHMMDCAECVSDVEVWRALRENLPEAANERSSTGAPPAASIPRATDSGASRPSAIGPRANGRGATGAGAGSGATGRRRFAQPVWRMAACLVGAATIGSAAGWFAHGMRGPGPELAAGEALFYNLPPTTRGVACTPLPINPRASVILLRIADATPGATVLAQSADGMPLGTGDYGVRTQDDGSWVLQFQAAVLRNRAIALSIQPAGGGMPESLGCITGAML